MTSEQADLAAIKELLDQYAARVRAGDLEGWMSLWAEGGVQMPDNAPTRVGKRQIRESMKPVFDGMDMSITINGIQDVDVWGDHGMTRCTYSLTLIPKGGGDRIEAMRDGKALTIYERQSDGTWKIVCDCFNSNAER